jgi:hypothetical protein
MPALPCVQGTTMEDDMVADAALWVIFAAAIAFLSCGCHYTRRPAAKVAEKRLDHNVDRAA